MIAARANADFRTAPLRPRHTRRRCGAGFWWTSGTSAFAATVIARGRAPSASSATR